MRGLALMLAAACALALAGCTSAPAKPQLTVAAAASLDAAFTELLERFAAEHPEVDVRPLILDGSSTLVTQLREGAPFNVIATANEATMEQVGELVDTPTVFATNVLVIAVAPGNPLGIHSLDDLAMRSERGDATVVLCARGVPCGDASAALADAVSAVIRPVSEEQSVTAVLTKVRSGEADAGLVYSTDVAAARGSVEAVDPGVPQSPTRYPVAVVSESPQRTLAQGFVDFVVSDAGRSVLNAHGFGAP